MLFSSLRLRLDGCSMFIFFNILRYFFFPFIRSLSAVEFSPSSSVIQCERKQASKRTNNLSVSFRAPLDSYSYCHHRYSLLLCLLSQKVGRNAALVKAPFKPFSLALQGILYELTQLRQPSAREPWSERRPITLKESCRLHSQYTKEKQRWEPWPAS